MRRPSASEGSFLSSVGTTAVSNLLATGASATAGILLARWLGASGRGDYAAVSAYFFLSLVIFELGLGSSVVFNASKDKRAGADYVKTAAFLFVPLALAAVMVSVMLGLTVFADSGPRRAAFLIVPLATVATFAGAPALFALQAVDLAGWNMARLTQPVVFFALAVGIHQLVDLNVPLVIMLLSVSLICQAGLAWWLYIRSGPGRGRLRRDKIRPMLSYGLSNVSSSAPSSLNSRGDQVVLALMVSSAALGQYAVAVSLSILAAPLVMAFGHVAFPGLARGERVAETIITAIRGASLASIAGIAVILLSAPLLVPALFGPGYPSVPRLLLVLAPGAALMVVNQVLGDILRGLGRPSAVARCEWVGILSTIAGLLLLVPGLGVMGAALTSTVTYSIVYVLLHRAVWREAKCPAHPVRKLLVTPKSNSGKKLCE